MNKHLPALLAFCAIGVTSAAAPAFGAESDLIRVTVPFAFTAGAKTLPAGDYTVAADSHVLLVRGSGGSAFLIAVPGATSDIDKSAVTFSHTDKGYVLKSVYSGGRPASVLPTAPSTER